MSKLTIKTIKEILTFTSINYVSNKRKIAVKELCDMLDNYCELDISLTQAEKLEGLTARQITWLRKIFNFTL